MTKNEIFELINKNPIFTLATTEGNQPHVRHMMLIEADEKNGILFNTAKQKSLYKQLLDNPLVEMCFYSAEENKQIRISGIAKSSDDIEVKQKVLKKIPSLKPLIEKTGYAVLATYYLKSASVYIWTQETNLNPSIFVEL